MDSNKAFQCIHKFVAKAEGGFSRHSADKGGITNHGISYAFLLDFSRTKAGASLCRDLDLLPVSEKTIIELTKENAKELMFHAFWVYPNIALLPPFTSMATYDFAINSGASKAIKTLQKILALNEDGIIGPMTKEKAAQKSDYPLALELIEARRAYFHSICEANPSQKVFLKGWLNRLTELEKFLATKR